MARKTKSKSVLSGQKKNEKAEIGKEVNLPEMKKKTEEKMEKEEKGKGEMRQVKGEKEKINRRNRKININREASR